MCNLTYYVVIRKMDPILTIFFELRLVGQTRLTHVPVNLSKVYDFKSFITYSHNSLSCSLNLSGDYGLKIFCSF